MEKIMEDKPVVESVPFWGAEKKFTKPDYNLGNGYFAKIDSYTDTSLTPNSWQSCRETFQNYLPMTALLMCHEPNIGRNIAEFMNIFETRMGHQKITVCGPTNWNRVTWIIPAKFWVDKPMRFSLLTALLRAAVRYVPAEENFDKALYSYNYTKGTKAAIEMFMQGRTWYKGDVNGWYRQFQGVKSEEELKKLLTRKPISPNDLMNFALEKLGISKNDLIIDFRKTKYGYSAKEAAEEMPEE